MMSDCGGAESWCRVSPIKLRDSKKIGSSSTGPGKLWIQRVYWLFECSLIMQLGQIVSRHIASDFHVLILSFFLFYSIHSSKV